MPTESDAMLRSLKKWEVTRQKGRWRYVAIQGVLLWGIPMFLFMTFLFDHYVEGHPLTAARVTGSLITWLIAGVIFGLVMWFVMERKYKKHLGQP
mgnify:CR=1 FL=1